MGKKQVLYPRFLDFMVQCGALLFGDFTLKSGRKSPYFINTGEYKTGAQLARLGDFYAKLIDNSVRPENEWGGIDEKTELQPRTELNDKIKAAFSVLYGPAYKGIPLVTAASAKLAQNGLDLNVSFNRKEKKDHGEAGQILGYIPQNGDKIAVLEDVTTAGTSVRETIALLESLRIEARISALYISVDRLERGTGGKSATVELAEKYGLRVHSIATAADVVEYLENPTLSALQIPDAAKHAANIRAYLKEYGAADR
ncbi:MAG: orotate phosphoribosyltransferase [Oscillospiraceae bacterium]|jgi:orotate phosphoribosyltransferase|nr:orotate phosphoribosyltransferase [Oscillospiraceae bacterium]